MAEASVVQLLLRGVFQAVEQLEGLPGAGTDRIVNEKFNRTETALTPSTTPAVSRVSYATYTIAAGVADIDLTALAGTQDAIDGTGLKVQAIMVRNKGANPMTLCDQAATNKYDLLGVGNATIVPAYATLNPWLLFVLPEQLPDIAAGAKTIRISGTNADTADVAIALG